MAKNKRQEQKEITRVRIMDTAYRMYETGGFFAPTSRIAKEAGISHGSVFLHFPTREDLQLAVLERFSGEVCCRLHDLSLEDAGISDMLHAHIGVLEHYEMFYKNLVSELPLLPDEMKMQLVSVQTVMSHHFGIVIERGRQCRDIKDIPLHMLFNTWMGLLHYYLQNSEFFAPGASVLSSCKDMLVDSYVSLISK